MLRSLVSGPRHRFKDARANVNLDLAYITPRVIAMSFPSAGVEAAYRYPAASVARFLNERHGGKYLIFNLSERKYDVDYVCFEHRVVELGFPDHYSAPLELLLALTKSIDAWLASDPEHVAVVHCLAGKGRTGLVVAAYLLFSGYVLDPAALRLTPRSKSELLLENAAEHSRSPESPADTGMKPFAASSVALRTNAAAALSPDRSAPFAAISKEGDSDDEELESDGVDSGDDDGGHGGPSDAVEEVEEEAALGTGEASHRTQPSKASASGKVCAPTHAASGDAHCGHAPAMSLPSAQALANRATRHFICVRGAGLSYPSQRRSVGYFAQLVRECLLREVHAAASESVTAASEPSASSSTAASSAAAGGANARNPCLEPMTPDGSSAAALSSDVQQPVLGAAAAAASRLASSPLDVARAGASTADALATSFAWSALASKLCTAMRDIALPPPPAITILNVILYGVPVMKSVGGITPNLVVRTLPHQHAETEVRYESLWGDPTPATHRPDEEVILFQLNATMAGDVLIECMHVKQAGSRAGAHASDAQGGAGARAPPAASQPSKQKGVFRFSFHTAFLAEGETETGRGVFRMHKRDLDIPKRARNHKRLPDSFYVDVVYRRRKQLQPESGASPAVSVVCASRTRSASTEGPAEYLPPEPVLTATEASGTGGKPSIGAGAVHAEAMAAAADRADTGGMPPSQAQGAAATSADPQSMPAPDAGIPGHAPPPALDGSVVVDERTVLEIQYRGPGGVSL